MKSSILILLVLSRAATISAAEVMLKAVVNDEEGRPIEGSTVTFSTFSHWQPGEGFGTDVRKEMRVTTDRIGVASGSLEAVRGELTASAAKEGYYLSGHFKQLISLDNAAEKKPALVEWRLELKSRGKGAPFFGRKIINLKVPVLGLPLGFDLMVGDWVSPYGNGLRGDIYFKLEPGELGRPTPRGGLLEVTFPEPDDGIIRVDVGVQERGELRLPKVAPTFGYRPSYVKGSKALVGTNGGSSGIDEGANFIMRVRSKRQNGTLVSAQYGKVYGDFIFDALNGYGILTFSYYVNADEQSQSLEFDLTQNRLTNLPRAERQTAP